MEFSEFNKLLNIHKKFNQMTHELSNIGIDLYEGKYEIVNTFDDLFTASIESHYNKFGIDWIEWFIYENKYGTNNLGAYDICPKTGTKKLICQTKKQLWKYIKQYKK